MAALDAAGGNAAGLAVHFFVVLHTDCETQISYV
jgi:hypothetical protein